MSVQSIEEQIMITADKSTLNVTYNIESDASDSALDVLNSSSVPQPGDAYSNTYNNYIAQSDMNLENRDNDYKRKYWALEVTYKKRTSGTNVTLTGGQDRLESFRIRPQRYEVVMEEGYLLKSSTSNTYTWTTNKVPVLNSAKFPPDPPPMTTKANIVLEWTQIEEDSFDPTVAMTYLNTTNKTDVRILGKDVPLAQGKMLEIQPTWAGDRYKTKYSVEVEIEKTIFNKIMDAGFRRKEPTSALGTVPILNKDVTDVGSDEEERKAILEEADINPKAPVEDPVALDGNGNVHPDVKDNTAPSNVDAKFFIYRDIEGKDWSQGLNLVQELP